MRQRIEAVKSKQKAQFEVKQKKGMKRCNFEVNDKVLKRNSRKDSRKGGRLTADWMGPYDIKDITPKGVCVLSNKGIQLKTSTNSCQLKPYVERVVKPPCTDTFHTDHTYAMPNTKRKCDSFEESSSGVTPEKSRCTLQQPSSREEDEQPSQTCMDEDDNDEPIVGVVAFAKSCNIEHIEAVLDIADTCTRPLAKDPKQLASLMSTNPVVSLLEQDTDYNSVTAVATVLAGVRPSNMSEDLYWQSSHKSGTPIIAAGAVVYAFTMGCDVVAAAQTLLLYPSHLKAIPTETVNLTASNGWTISSGNITLDSSDLSTLAPDKWLNDQVKITHMALC